MDIDQFEKLQFVRLRDHGRDLWEQLLFPQILLPGAICTGRQGEGLAQGGAEGAEPAEVSLAKQAARNAVASAKSAQSAFDFYK